MSNIICPSCKASAPPGAIFCDNCGYDLRTIASAGEQPVAPTFLVQEPDASELQCPNCGHANIAGSIFCENCGTKLQQPPPAGKPNEEPKPAVAGPAPAASTAEPKVEEAAPETPAPPKLDSIPGRLVIVETNVSLPIPPGSQSIVIGREDPVSGVFPDLDLDPHGGHEAGVGRRHAQLLLKDGQVFIEDLDSVNGTAVNKQKIEPRKPFPIHPGDEVRLGKMILNYMSK